MDLILQYSFLQNSILAALLSGIACGIIGSYIVARRLVFLSGGITHSSFGGIGIAYYMGKDPVLGALIFGIMAALGIEYMSNSLNGKRISEDSAIGILWSLGMAIGIIFVFLTPGYAPNLMTFLFGNILLVSANSLVWLAIFDIILIVLIVCFYRIIIYSALDREYARTCGIPTKFIGYVMTSLISICIVLNIKVVGIMMLISLLTMPAVIMNNITSNFKTIIIGSTIIATMATVIGIIISYQINIPSSAATIVTLSGIFIIVKIIFALINHKTALNNKRSFSLDSKS